MRMWPQMQIENKFIYVPFLLALGAATYFTRVNEPNFIAMCIIGAMSAGATLIRRTPTIIRAIMICVLGFCWAGIYTNIINTPILQHNMRDVQITGTVESIDHNYKGDRLWLKFNPNNLNTADNHYARARLTIMPDTTSPNIGDTVVASGALFKPTSADAPESFDFARWAYFNNLTATGYVTDIDIIASDSKSNIATIRQTLHKNTKSFLVDALVLGYKNAVPESDAEIWFNTGIGHVWSISGFHMTLVGGWIFIVFYLLFRAIPVITRRMPAKIPAMACAQVGLLGYLVLSGCDTATMRAFLMTTLIFIAFAIGRSVISVRNVALVFCILFWFNPHCVMQAGFQLSFAAVFGLVWIYSVVKPRMPKNRLAKVIWATVLTSGVATLFTAPFVAAHFGAIPTYGLLGNLIILPVFSFLIMPAVLIGTITTIFNVHMPVEFAHNVYGYALDVAEYIANLPGANITVPHISNAAIVCFIIGLVCLINMRTKLNLYACGILCILGVTLMITSPKPVFFVTGDHVLAGFVNNDKSLEFNKSRDSNHMFAFDTWKQINGQSTSDKNIRRKHDKGVYKYETKNFNLVYIQKFVPLMNNLEQMCNDDNIDFIVSYFKINAPQCKHKILNNGFVIYPNGRVKYTPTNRRWHHNRHAQNTNHMQAQ